MLAMDFFSSIRVANGLILYLCVPEDAFIRSDNAVFTRVSQVIQCFSKSVKL